MAKEIFYVSGWCHSPIDEVHQRCAGVYAKTRCTCPRCNHPLVRVELPDLLEDMYLTDV